MLALDVLTPQPEVMEKVEELPALLARGHEGTQACSGLGMLAQERAPTSHRARKGNASGLIETFVSTLQPVLHLVSGERMADELVQAVLLLQP